MHQIENFIYSQEESQSPSYGDIILDGSDNVIEVAGHTIAGARRDFLGNYTKITTKICGIKFNSYKDFKPATQ